MIGYVVVNYNDYKSTIKLIKNIEKYSSINEIVVIDNYSTNDSLKHLKSLECKRLKIIASSHNRGYSDALNQGSKYLINKYKKIKIIFSNSDVSIPNEECIKKMSRALNKYDIVAPQINNNGTISRGWKISSISDEILLNIPLIQKRIFKRLRYDEECYKKEITEVDTVSGCFFMLNSRHLEKINYFDDNLFLYYEENVFGYNTKKINKKIAVINSITINHLHSFVIDKYVTKIAKIYLQKKSQEYYLKNYLKANKFQMFLYNITKNIQIILLKIKYL